MFSVVDVCRRSEVDESEMEMHKDGSCRQFAFGGGSGRQAPNGKPAPLYLLFPLVNSSFSSYSIANKKRSRVLTKGDP